MCSGFLLFPSLCGSVSPCSTTCGPGSQTRSVACTYSDGQTSTACSCGASSQSCSAGDCVGWTAGGFGACSYSPCAATGTQTQSVNCWDYTTNSPGSGCTGPAPASSQTCYPPHCYSWTASGFPPCTASPPCAYSMTQTQTVQCWDSTAGGATSPSNCGGAAPPSSQTCYPPHCYSWHGSGWGTCMGCGGTNAGTQTQTWTCYDDTLGTTAPASNWCWSQLHSVWIAFATIQSTAPM